MGATVGPLGHVDADRLAGVAAIAARSIEERAVPAVASGEPSVEFVVGERANRKPQGHARDPTGEVGTRLGLVVDEELRGPAIGEERDRFETIHGRSILTKTTRPG